MACGVSGSWHALHNLSNFLIGRLGYIVLCSRSLSPSVSLLWFWILSVTCVFGSEPALWLHLSVTLWPSHMEISHVLLLNGSYLPEGKGKILFILSTFPTPTSVSKALTSSKRREDRRGEADPGKAHPRSRGRTVHSGQPRRELYSEAQRVYVWTSASFVASCYR